MLMASGVGGVSVGLIAGLFVSFSMGSTASLWNESKVWTMTDFPLIRHIYFKRKPENRLCLRVK